MRRELAIQPVRSLAWCGDDLIDWLGGTRISLDGNVQAFGTGYGYRFDYAYPACLFHLNGWIWQPWNSVCVYDITKALLAQPSVNLKPPEAPFVAIDPSSPRFAVAHDDRLIVIGRNA